MEGINILATKMVFDYGIGSMWVLVIGLLLFFVGIIGFIYWDKDSWIGAMLSGVALSFFSLVYILMPVKAQIATIENDVPYKYIEEHYKIKDKTDNLYTLIPLKEEK